MAGLLVSTLLACSGKCIGTLLLPLSLVAGPHAITFIYEPDLNDLSNWCLLILKPLIVISLREGRLTGGRTWRFWTPATRAATPGSTFPLLPRSIASLSSYPLSSPQQTRLSPSESQIMLITSRPYPNLTTVLPYRTARSMMPRLP